MEQVLGAASARAGGAIRASPTAALDAVAGDAIASAASAASITAAIDSAATTATASATSTTASITSIASTASIATSATSPACTSTDGQTWPSKECCSRQLVRRRRCRAAAAPAALATLATLATLVTLVTLVTPSAAPAVAGRDAATHVMIPRRLLAVEALPLTGDYHLLEVLPKGRDSPAGGAARYYCDS